MSIHFLEFFWYCVIYASLLAFSALDGFDLGVGMLHPIGRNDEERRMFLNAIGPVWDGNAVWLIIVAGALFAGFPPGFAAIFSSMYDLTMLLLVGIIFRAVAIEFRSKRESKVWRSCWDYAFFVASIFISVVVGLILANLITGLPIDQYGIYKGNFSTFFNPYTIFFALTVCSLFTMHGSIYIMLKTEAHTRLYVRRFALVLSFLFILCYCILGVLTWFLVPHMRDMLIKYPWVGFFGGINALIILNLIKEIYIDHAGRAFVCSLLNIAILFVICAVENFPNLIRSTLSPDFHLTIYNARSSKLTLIVLFTIVAIGLPFVAAYSFWLYKTFKGKVVIDSHSY